jgi:uncharacterized protein (UPF0210 family)
MPSRRHSLLDPHTAAFPPLEVRTVTLCLNAADLADRNLHKLCDGLYQRIVAKAGKFVNVCGAVAAEFGVPILQRRVCVNPLDRLTDGFGADDLVNIARTLDGAAANVHVDQIAGYLARVPHGMSGGARQMIAAMPTVLSRTERVQAAVEVARSDSGIPLDAVELLGYKLKEAAEATAEGHGIGAAKLSIIANLPGDGPPISGVCPGEGWGDLVVHVSVSAMSAIRHAVEQRLKHAHDVHMSVLAADIKAAVFQSVRVAELIGREIAQRLTADFGRVDVSLAPTVRPGQTIAELLQRLGIASFGSPGTAAALMMLWGAVRAAGGFASASAAGHAAVLLPVLRDAGLVAATEAGSLAIEHLEQLATVGGLGLDLIPVPGDTDARTLSAVMADQLAGAIVNRRPTVIRLVPVPGKRAGDRVSFGRDLGDGVVLPVASAADSTFIQRGGRVPGFR